MTDASKPQSPAFVRRHLQSAVIRADDYLDAARGRFRQIAGTHRPRHLAAYRGWGDATEREFDASMEFTSATYEGEPCLQIVFRQQTVDANMVRELDTLRQRDPVTELFNRQHFMTEVEAAVAVAADGKGVQSLLLVEPDNYENRLGEIGLAHADELLKQIAASLTGFFAVLAEWSRTDMPDPANDNGDEAATGDEDVRDER